MVVRKYREIGSTKVVAGIIASEVIESGKSDGWQGSLEELSQIEKILSDFNISYVTTLPENGGTGKARNRKSSSRLRQGTIRCYN